MKTGKPYGKKHDRLWYGKLGFASWLNRQRTATPFISDKNKRTFLYRLLSPGQRRTALAHFEAIEPGSREKIIGLRRKDKYRLYVQRRQRNLQRREINTLLTAAKLNAVADENIKRANEAMLALAQNQLEKEGITAFRFVPADGVRNVIACLRAAGYTPGEVAGKMHVDMNIVLSVPASLIASQRKNFNEAIVAMMDQKVLYDGASGEITETTERADRIAARRRKLYLDATKLVADQKRADASLTPEQIEEKRRIYRERFGVSDGKDESTKKE
jgi:hypothetical protein